MEAHSACNIPPGDGLPVRRQNKSCDQCRAGKRRCDVQVRIQPGAWGGNQHFWLRDDDESSKPCSNCKKWKKACTTEWLKSHHRQRSTPKKRQRTSKTAVNEDALRSNTGKSDGVCAQQTENIDPLFSDYAHQVTSIPAFTNASSISSVSTIYSESLSSSGHDSAGYLEAQPFQQLSSLMSAECLDSSSYHQNLDQPNLDSDIAVDCWSSPSIYSNDTEYWHGTSTVQVDTEGKKQDREHNNGHSSPTRHETGFLGPSSTPSSSHFLTEDHNRLYIKKGLLKIYHDSLEGALGCWLTERNCPYTSRPFLDSNDTWGSRWGNRILSRVTALDDTYAKCSVISSSSQKEASNVLNLAVMAFAAQWAQAAYQSHGNLREQMPEHGIFERNLQKTLWHKANNALSRATNNPSFKVIFAAVIFALTQRPMEAAEVLATSGTPGQSYSESLRKIFELDTGAIFLDIAVRKLHDHRRRLQDSEQCSDNDVAQGLGFVKEDDKQTFGLIFWLAIMCDTLVAAMNRRSFVLSDADTSVINEKPPSRRVSRFSNGSCDLDGYSTLSSADSSYLDRESQIWGDYFLGQETRIGEVRKESARWPCSYTDAAACLADAAPVKVLLFRRAAHLQDLYYQRASAEDIERAITSTLEVYIHWNNTYGCFIGDCVAHHETLPPRIQSWYTLLACHWHLAVLLVADLIDKLDEGYMTTASNRLTRQTTEFTSALRFRSVYAISDLGRCSRYNEELSFSQSPDFHHAVNKAALLTEPWTLILVRCFSHAGEVLVKVIHSQLQPGLFMITDDLSQARTRLSDCIQALRLLGRKSDLALNAAKILQAAVDHGAT